MKNIILFGALLVLLFTGCRKNDDDPVFGRTPDERLNEVLNKMQQELSSSPYGWKAVLYPDGGAGYGFYFTFTNNNRVSMLTDIAAQTTATQNNSTWRLKALQRPTLLFDTYSYLHLLSDPDPRVIGGEAGFGFLSDFNFGLDSLHGDTLDMTGISQNSKLILIKATNEEAAAYKNGSLKTIQEEIDAYMQATPFLSLEGSTEKYTAFLNGTTRNFSMSKAVNGSLVTQKDAFGYTNRGIFLKKAFNIGGHSFREVIWDRTKKQLYIMVDNKRVDLVGSDKPTFALHQMIGVDLAGILVPPNPIIGWTSPFYTIWKQADTNLRNGDYGFQLYYTEMTFDKEKDNMIYTVYLVFRGRLYAGKLRFSYTQTADGIFAFAYQDIVDQIGGLIEKDVQPLVNLLNTNKFKIEFLYPAAGGILGKVTSVDTPDMSFSGQLQ